MCQTKIIVWFVCKLCQGSFGQVDAFIEHKKQKHFTQFQNTTSIVFEEREPSSLYPVITSDGDHQLADEISEPSIKIEVNDDDPSYPFSSEIIDEPKLDLVEPKSELITFESEVNGDGENSFFGLQQPEPNPYVLLKRLTTDEIQRALFPQHQPTLLKCEQTIFVNNLDDPNSSDADSNTVDHNGVQKSTEIPPTTTFGISTEPVHQFECKLCSKQLESDAKLRIHVGICALYHEDRNRFCVSCNRKFVNNYNLKLHRRRFHGTEEEKSSLYKSKCHLCPKRFRDSIHLKFHLKSHKTKKRRLEISNSKLFRCSHPNCGKVYETKFRLERHISSVHLSVRPFSCSFPSCNKAFSQKAYMEAHFRTHTGERPYKCTVDNCKKAFTFQSQRARHHRAEHCN